MGKRKFELDFVGIGAEKAGTTWIADCLREHPEVHIPKTKEIFFFNDYDPHFLSIKNYRYRRGLKWYARQFNGSINKKVGEVSPTYLYGNVTVKRIKRNFPNTKIIVVLREPVARAFSQYIHDRRLGVIKDITFDEAVRMYRNYLEKGYYYNHLSSYFKYFPQDQILVMFHDDLLEKPKKSVKKMYKFLGLKNVGFIPKSLTRKKNIAGRAKYPFLNYLMMQLDYMLREKRMNFVLKAIDSSGLRRLAIYIRDRNSTSLTKYPKMKVETRKYLMQVYKTENEKLENLLKKNLKNWKS
jgi:hypothetical protein